MPLSDMLPEESCEFAMLFERSTAAAVLMTVVT